MSFDPHVSYSSFFISEDMLLIVSSTRSSVHLLALCAVSHYTVGVYIILTLVKDEIFRNSVPVLTFRFGSVLAESGTGIKVIARY